MVKFGRLIRIFPNLKKAFISPKKSFNMVILLVRHNLLDMQSTKSQFTRKEENIFMVKA